MPAAEPGRRRDRRLRCGRSAPALRRRPIRSSRPGRHSPGAAPRRGLGIKNRARTARLAHPRPAGSPRQAGPKRRPRGPRPSARAPAGSRPAGWAAWPATARLDIFGVASQEPPGADRARGRPLAADRRLPSPAVNAEAVIVSHAGYRWARASWRVHHAPAAWRCLAPCRIGRIEVRGSARAWRGGHGGIRPGSGRRTGAVMRTGAPLPSGPPSAYHRAVSLKPMP